MDITSLLVGVGVGSCIVGSVVAFLLHHVYLIRVHYQLILRGDDNSTSAILHKFSRVYWKQKHAENDVVYLSKKCENIRHNYIDNDDTIINMIDENYEVDFSRVYLEYKFDTIKPM